MGEINEGENECSKDEDDITYLNYLIWDKHNTERDESIELVLSEDEVVVQSNLKIGESSLTNVESKYENSDDEMSYLL